MGQTWDIPLLLSTESLSGRCVKRHFIFMWHIKMTIKQINLFNCQQRSTEAYFPILFPLFFLLSAFISNWIPVKWNILPQMILKNILLKPCFTHLFYFLAIIQFPCCVIQSVGLSTTIQTLWSKCLEIQRKFHCKYSLFAIKAFLWNWNWLFIYISLCKSCLETKFTEYMEST